MNRYRLLLTVATLAAAVVFSGAAAQDQPGDDELSPLPWGPVHEAYAQPYSADPQPSPIVPKQPPEPIEEVPPDVKPEGDNVQWMPGYFAWDEEYQSFLWVSGFWRDVPPGREWIPGTWIEVQGGWQWIGGYWADVSATQVDYLPPPPDSIDGGPSIPPPQVESVYAPGCWVWRQRWLWRPGFWVPVRPGWAYIPAHYHWTPAGFLFVEGYWDRPLHRRGVLFSPVWARWDRFLRPGWVYRPTYVISTPALSAALFVRNDRPATFYFGNYFAPEYRRNFVPWVDYRVRRNVPDPLLGYYRARERDFATALTTRYEARLAGREAPPPSSFKKQTEIIQNLTVNRTVVVGKQTFKVDNVAEAARALSLVAPLETVDRKELRLQALTKERVQQERKAVQELRSLAQERRKLEAALVAKGPAKGEEPRRVELPKLAARPKQVKVDTPPPPPLPKVKQETPPPKKEVPPGKKGIDPPKKDFPPPKKEKELPPPPKKDIDPPKKDFPPKKDVLPPKKEKDPPPPPKKKEIVPPPPPPKKEVVPPPPPKKDSPPPPPPKKEKDPPPKKEKDRDDKPAAKKAEKQPPPGPDVKPPKDDRKPKADGKEKDKKDKAATLLPPLPWPRDPAAFVSEPPPTVRWLDRRGWAAAV